MTGHYDSARNIAVVVLSGVTVWIGLSRFVLSQFWTRVRLFTLSSRTLVELSLFAVNRRCITTRRYASAVYAMTLCPCLSVCHQSVLSKTAKRRIIQTTPHDNPVSSFLTPKILGKSNAWLLQLSLSQPAQVSGHPAPTDPELSRTYCCQSSQIQSHHFRPSVSTG